MIKLLDLQKINAQYANELKQAAAEVIESDWYLLGEKVKQFEQDLKNYIGCPNALALILAAARYTDNDYIRNYEEFMELVK